jgi:hypothetical protein
MKTQTNDKPGNNTGNPSSQRATGLRAHAARTFEHRNERRKIREQLRRVDWAHNVEDEVFA